MKFSPGSAATGRLLFAGLAALLISSQAVTAAEPTAVAVPLTAGQVQCSADQLRSILGRSAVVFGPAYIDSTGMFLFTYGGPSRTLSGLALLEQSDSAGETQGPERQLAFTVTAGAPGLARNPQKRALDSSYLLRTDASSDIGSMDDPSAMAVLVDPTLDPSHNEDAATLLVIDNLSAQESGVASDSKAGRGLTRLLDRCPSPLTAADLHVFNVLSRVLRATAFTTRESDSRARRAHKLATIYRGQEAVAISTGVRASYRIDFYPVVGAAPLHRVSLEIEIDLGADGALGEATLRLLPACASAADGQAGCSTATSEVDVAVIQPASAEKLWNMPAPMVCWNGGSGCPSQVSFSFPERLQGTTWLRP